MQGNTYKAQIKFILTSSIKWASLIPSYYFFTPALANKSAIVPDLAGVELLPLVLLGAGLLNER